MALLISRLSISESYMCVCLFAILLRWNKIRRHINCQGKGHIWVSDLMSKQINTFKGRGVGMGFFFWENCRCRQLDFHIFCSTFFRFSAFPFVSRAKSTTADADNLPRELVYGLGVGWSMWECLWVRFGMGFAMGFGWDWGSGAKPTPWPTFAATFSICGRVCVCALA